MKLLKHCHHLMRTALLVCALVATISRPALAVDDSPNAETDRLRAQSVLSLMLPVYERKRLQEVVVSKGATGEGGATPSASLAQSAGLAAGLSAGNPLSGSGLTRGGNALAVVSLLSLFSGKAADPADRGVANLSTIIVPGVVDGVELWDKSRAALAAQRITESAIETAAVALGRTAQCTHGCDGSLQIWSLDVAQQPSLTVVWKQGDVIAAMANQLRHASLPFVPAWESAGWGGWVIELAAIERDAAGEPVFSKRGTESLPSLTRSWAATPDGIRFLQALTADGHIAFGRRAAGVAAALGKVYEIGELTVSGFLPKAINP